MEHLNLVPRVDEIWDFEKIRLAQAVPTRAFEEGVDVIHLMKARLGAFHLKRESEKRGASKQRLDWGCRWGWAVRRRGARGIEGAGQIRAKTRAARRHCPLCCGAHGWQLTLGTAPGTRAFINSQRITPAMCVTGVTDVPYGTGVTGVTCVMCVTGVTGRHGWNGRHGGHVWNAWKVWSARV